jgi:hypothetical protein
VFVGGKLRFFLTKVDVEVSEINEKGDRWSLGNFHSEGRRDMLNAEQGDAELLGVLVDSTLFYVLWYF